MTAAYQRLATAPLAEVLGHVRAAMERSAASGRVPTARGGTRSKLRVEISGVPVKVSSLRLRAFAVHGTTCSACGLKATHFAIEKAARSVVPNEAWHLNLYGTRADGHEVLFTHDHTHARGLGGADSLDNTTTMCAPCNAKKSLAESAECHRRDRCFVIINRKTQALMVDPRTQEHLLAPTFDEAQTHLTQLLPQGIKPADWAIDTHARWRLQRPA